ncbi:hypothetical protein [Blastococcus tunisiensis]|uniref:Uncharacterized protein n=1 Tax=Blastococcus tunisiensis TaxID=1798228 RepID=A0A1I2DLM3_9ACTN|nr:hypothetical protein [Blastococcus sp. DSM 46838]SFE80820.1 hypothetical protein SAMN05216574_10626 [Blastococcus sp. DSM 46838]
MRPELMAVKRGGSGTAAPEEQRAAAVSAPQKLTAEVIAGWAQLTGHRPSPRAPKPAR